MEGLGEKEVEEPVIRGLEEVRDTETVTPTLPMPFTLTGERAQLPPDEGKDQAPLEFDEEDDNTPFEVRTPSVEDSFRIETPRTAHEPERKDDLLTDESDTQQRPPDSILSPFALPELVSLARDLLTAVNEGRYTMPRIVKRFEGSPKTQARFQPSRKQPAMVLPTAFFDDFVSRNPEWKNYTPLVSTDKHVSLDARIDGRGQYRDQRTGDLIEALLADAKRVQGEDIAAASLSKG